MARCYKPSAVYAMKLINVTRLNLALLYQEEMDLMLWGGIAEDAVICKSFPLHVACPAITAILLNLWQKPP